MLLLAKWVHLSFLSKNFFPVFYICNLYDLKNNEFYFFLPTFIMFISFSYVIALTQTSIQCSVGFFSSTSFFFPLICLTLYSLSSFLFSTGSIKFPLVPLIFLSWLGSYSFYSNSVWVCILKKQIILKALNVNSWFICPSGRVNTLEYSSQISPNQFTVNEQVSGIVSDFCNDGDSGFWGVSKW